MKILAELIRKRICFLALMVFSTLLLTGWECKAEFRAYKQMIAGKEYRIEPAEEKGVKGCWVYYGDQARVWWEPKPWHPKGLQKEGPAYAVINWGMKKGLFYPFDVDVNERVKNFDGQEVYKRYVSVEDTAQMKDWKGGFGILIIDPSGTVRRRHGGEWKRHYQRFPEIFNKEGIFNKRNIFLSWPESVKGVGVMSKIYMAAGKEDENWLYLPSVRKVRRMSTGARQDFAFGTPMRNEDFPQMTPFLHHFKIKGLEVFKDPGPKEFGFGGEDFIRQMKDPDFPRGFDNVGELCWVIEVTHGPKNWWFDKRVMYVSTNTLANMYYSYDNKGELVQTTKFDYRVANEYATEYAACDPQYLLWAGDVCHDLKSGWKSIFVGATNRTKELFNESYFDAGFDEGIFDPLMLLREPTSSLQY